MSAGACGRGVREPSRLDRGVIRHIQSDPKAAVPLIQELVALCDAMHNVCSNKAHKALPTRVIEVSGAEGDCVRLIQGATCEGKYVALSYR
jgi:hypothetical protein